MYTGENIMGKADVVNVSGNTITCSTTDISEKILDIFDKNVRQDKDNIILSASELYYVKTVSGNKIEIMKKILIQILY